MQVLDVFRAVTFKMTFFNSEPTFLQKQKSCFIYASCLIDRALLVNQLTQRNICIKSC